jgi:hypothetical protein
LIAQLRAELGRIARAFADRMTEGLKATKQSY